MTKPPSDTAAETLELAEAVRETIGKFVRSVRVEADTPTSAQTETLGFLDRDGPLSIAALAERRNVKHQSMRLVIGQMEAHGHISRIADPQDGRGQLISLTEAGQQALTASRQARAQRIATALAVKTTAEEQALLRAALAILDRLA